MLCSRNVQLVSAVGVMLLATATATAQCQTLDFEDYSVGTAITNHYPGVYFSAAGQSCGGSPTLYMRVADEFYGDGFSSKVLLIDQGCPDFSDDYLRMVFNKAHDDVSFTLGPWGSEAGYTYEVRVYDVVSAGVPIATQTVEVLGTAFADVHHLVRITRPTCEIRRVEVEAASSGFEAIDDLIFGMDSTPPFVEIHTPTADECLCGTVTLIGLACDDDGAYDRDWFEYRRVWPTTDADWTFVKEYVNQPVCGDPFPLYEWQLDDPNDPVPEGLYLLRVTARNFCGATASAEVTVYVDTEFNTIEIDKPQYQAVVGGDICFDGTVWDSSCFSDYVVEYREYGDATWYPVDPDNLTYTTQVANDPIAEWVAASSLADGDYVIRVIGHTDCGASLAQATLLTLDNTAPIAEISSPPVCSQLDGIVTFSGTADDANLDRWELEYWNPDANTWIDIAEGTTPVIEATLGDWDASALAPCYYVVRLRVWDESILDICGDVSRQRSDHYVGVAIGDPCPGDLTGDGRVTLSDLAELLMYYGNICW